MKAKSESSEACERGRMRQCTASLKLLTNSKDLGMAMTSDELTSICPSLTDGVECVDNITSSCLRPSQRAYFNTLHAGTKQTINKLCYSETYRREYLSHGACMRAAQQGYSMCARQYRRSRNAAGREARYSESGAGLSGPDGDASSHNRQTCCAFIQYVTCSETVVRRECGTDAANFAKNFLQTLTAPIVRGHCYEYQGDPLVCSSVDAIARNGNVFVFSLTAAVFTIFARFALI